MHQGRDAGESSQAIDTGNGAAASHFFEDPAALEFLKEWVLPAIFEKKKAGDSVRVWVPVCGTGEEAYSIAILVQELLARGTKPLAPRIFATDPDEVNVGAGRKAWYPASIARQVSEARLRELFVEDGGGFRVRSLLRDRCVFARHDPACDPVLGRMDLIAVRRIPARSCGALLPRLYHALRADGYLLVAPAQRALLPAGLFQPIAEEHGIYRRTYASVSARVLSFARRGADAAPRPEEQAPKSAARVATSKSFEQILVEHLVPASAIVDERGDVVYLAGKIARYLRLPSGDAGVNVVALARPSIRPAVGEAVKRALMERREIVRRGLAVIDDGAWHPFDLAVKPLAEREGHGPSLLVVFHEAPSRDEEGVAPDEPSGPAAGDDEPDLERVNAALRASNEQLAASNEELSTALDEVQRAQDALATAKAALDHRLRELVDVVPSMLWAANASGMITYANEHWYEHAGLPAEVPPADLFVGNLHPEDHDGFVRAWDAARTEGAHFEAEFRQRASDGTYRWFLARANPVRDEEGAVTGWFGVSTDIHDQRLAADLQAADRRKNELLAALAHDLRSPLAVIQHAAYVLGRTASGDASARLREMIDRQVSRMTRMIEDLLDVSRISQGKVTLKQEPLDLAQLVRALAEDERPLMEGRGLLLEVTLPPRPVHILGDDTRLSQVVGNLLHNARKFTDAGGKVHLALRHARGEARARLTVEDTGIGISADILPHIFDAFTQADRSRDRSGGGLGLGLSLVEGLVALHGGSVRAESAGLGQGATFTVDFPVMDEGPDEAEAPIATPAPEATTERPRRVLIVEDNDDLIEPMQTLFELCEHQVATARTGAEALAVASTFRPDIVLCDIGLPGMSGYDVARALRADPALRHAYLIALTGFARQEDKAKAQEAGFDLHLAKPMGPDEVERVVRNLKSE